MTFCTVINYGQIIIWRDHSLSGRQIAIPRQAPDAPSRAPSEFVGMEGGRADSAQGAWAGRQQQTGRLMVFGVFRESDEP